MRAVLLTMALVGAGARRSGSRRPRRPPHLGRAMMAVGAATLLPGLGHLLLGRRRTGGALLGGVLLAAAAVVVAVLRMGRGGLLQNLVSTRVLTGVMVGCLLVGAGWITVILRTYLLTRPRELPVGSRVLGAAVVGSLCFAVAVPLGSAAELAHSQRTLLDAVFPAPPARATRLEADRPPLGPTIARPRLNVLLLGSDAGPDRAGTRTDTMMVASVDTRTAATILFALPRNLQRAPFPPGSPMSTRFPDGFSDPADPTSGDHLLNAVYGYGAAYPDLAPAGPTGDPGVNLLMSSISEMLTLPLPHYVEVDVSGLAAIIDAVGGVTVDVGPVPLPIGGVTATGRHVRPEGYVPAGVHHLTGDQALWFARSRRDSDDYARMGRQRCLIQAVLTQKDPVDLLTNFRSAAAAAASSVRTDIPQSLLPALVELADDHHPPLLRSISFDPSLLDPTARDQRFDPARPDIPYMRQVVSAAVAAGAGARPTPGPATDSPAPSPPPESPAPSSAPQSPAPVPLAGTCG